MTTTRPEDPAETAQREARRLAWSEARRAAKAASVHLEARRRAVRDVEAALAARLDQRHALRDAAWFIALASFVAGAAFALGVVWLAPTSWHILGGR